MTPEELAENVKRLREINALKQRSEQPISETFKPINQARAELDYHNICHDSMPQAIQTINALVQLVGEMHERLLHYEFKTDTTPAKSAPIAQLAKEVTE